MKKMFAMALTCVILALDTAPLSAEDGVIWVDPPMEEPAEEFMNLSFPVQQGEGYAEWHGLSCPSSFKSFENGVTAGGRILFTEGSAQHMIQQAAVTEDGFRKAEGRYLVAVGSGAGCSVGQKMDVVLENGVMIPCIMGDLKADRDTDGTNTYTVSNGCCLEFIVCGSLLPDRVRLHGDVSKYRPEWESPVKGVWAYGL